MIDRDIKQLLILPICRPEEHHIIYRQIGNLPVRRDLAGVGQDIGFLHMIVLVLHESIQRAVDGVVLENAQFTALKVELSAHFNINYT